MNGIVFNIQKRVDLDVDEVIPVIDGEPLTHMIDRFELDARMSPAGNAYAGLIPAYYRFGPLAGHYAGRLTGATDAKTPLLGCECGEWGCWPLMAQITISETEVIWDRFQQPHRPGSDYTQFGPFHFGRLDYHNAVESVQSRWEGG